MTFDLLYWARAARLVWMKHRARREQRRFPRVYSPEPGKIFINGQQVGYVGREGLFITYGGDGKV